MYVRMYVMGQVSTGMERMERMEGRGRRERQRMTPTHLLGSPRLVNADGT